MSCERRVHTFQQVEEVRIECCDKKELEEVKKESKHNASKYATAQANLMMAETKRFIMFLPFIICGILLFLVVITKGGSWIQTATQYGMSKIRGE